MALNDIIRVGIALALSLLTMVIAAHVSSQFGRVMIIALAVPIILRTIKDVSWKALLTRKTPSE